MQMTESKSVNKKENKSEIPSTRFFVTIGEMDGAKEEEISNFVVSKAKITKEDIVDIKILEKFSFVEVKKGLEQNILSLKNLKFNGRKINVEVAGEKSKSSNKPKSKGQVNNSKKSGNFNNKKGNKSDKSRGNGKKGSNSSRSKNK